MLKTYRKITTIQAEQFDGSLSMANKYDMHQNVVYETMNDHFVANSLLPTLEGDMTVCKGDWIATGINGEHWAIADDVFRKTYEKVTGTVDIVSDYPGREITFSESEE